MSGRRARYEIEWSAGARRALNRLPEKIATVAVEFIYGPLVGNPQRAGHALHFELAGCHSARRGDYRIVYRIDPDAAVVTILTINHRADVYRPR